MLRFFLNFIPGVGPILSTVLGFFTTNGGSLISAVASYYQSKANAALEEKKTAIGADEQIALSMVQRDIEADKARTQLAISDKGWGPTAWMKPAAFYVCFVHFGAIVLDSTFRLNWQVATLPKPYDDLEWWIIITCVGVVGTKSIVSRIFTK